MATGEIQIDDPSTLTSHGASALQLKKILMIIFETLSEYAILPLIGIKHWQVGQELSPLL